MNLQDLDNELVEARRATEAPELSNHVWQCLATTIHKEIADLDEKVTNQLRRSVPVPPEYYLEEMKAFQTWMNFAHDNADNPVIVRAQVMTELYVCFVWLRDSLMKPIAERVTGQTAFATLERFLSSGRRRRLRNAIAHGRWCYLRNFNGLECWAELARDQPPQRFEISQADLDAWQLLSRGSAIAVLRALTEAS